MIYVEFIERDRFMPIEIFRHLSDQSAWTDPNDSLIGSFGRTMRIGPMPSYLAFWKCKGMERMDEWESHFRSPEAHNDKGELATHRAMHLQYAGCYDEIFSINGIDRNQLFLIEYLQAPLGANNDEIAQKIKMRASNRSSELCFLLRRIGKLGPDPGALAVWCFADYLELERFERQREDTDDPTVVSVGVYRWFGNEIL